MKLYIISAKAVADMENIWLYTLRTWSVEQADRYYKLIIDEIKYLAEHADSGKPIDYLKKGYRVSKVKSHLIFYKQLDENTIDIIRILHQRMDTENRLND